MAASPLKLPVLQNWSCHNCGGCCRQHAIYITPAERNRIAGQNWSAATGVPEAPAIFVDERSWLRPPQTRLAQRPDGACVFLDENGLCRIHAKFGEAAKPLACRIYPYAFHPAGKQLAVSLRFSCPSVAANLGRSLSSQRMDLKQLAAQVLPEDYRGTPAPRLTSRTRLDWPDTLRVVTAIDESLADEDSLSLKLMRTLFWLDVAAQARFEKITGERLKELLDLLSAAAYAEVPSLPAETLRPSPIAMSQFRLLAGQYARKDIAATIDTSLRGRWQQGRNAVRLARGQGLLPSLQPELAELPFAALEKSFGPLPAESEEMLSRYFRVKVQGLHFCGPGYYGIPVVEGFQSLALVFPVVMWLARWHRLSTGGQVAGDTWPHAAAELKPVKQITDDASAPAGKLPAAPCEQITHEDVLWGLTVADHQHGYSEAFRTWSSRRRVKNLAATGDLQKLIVWGSR